MDLFMIRIGVAGALALAIKGGVALTQNSVAWWLAAVIALAAVTVEWLIFGDGADRGAWE